MMMILPETDGSVVDIGVSFARCQSRVRTR